MGIHPTRLYVYVGIEWGLLISPILEWAIKFFLGAFPTNPGWGNYVRPKCKLLAMAFFLLCLSINVKPGSMAKPGNIACTMNLTTKLIQNNFSTNISWKNLQPFTQSKGMLQQMGELSLRLSQLLVKKLVGKLQFSWIK